MKKKITSSKVVMGTIGVASLVVPTSCNSDCEMEQVPQEVNNSNLNCAVSIIQNFTQEEINYILFVQSFTEQIVERSDIANEFAASPVDYMERHGYKVGNVFEVHAKHLRLITALGDIEVREKLDSKDLKGFLALCKEKGYAENYSGNLLKWISTYKSENNLYSKFANVTRAQVTEEFAVPVALFAVVIAAAVYYFLYVYKTGAWTKTQGASFTEDKLAQAYVSTILLTEDEKTAYMVCDEYIEGEVKIIVETIKEENPELTEMQLLELTNFLKKNIVQFNKMITNEEK
ncbi:hypothetical protein [uncultured Bacteroides sp.]|uniref:hypothetical protein n=1 Tax=uncultured Bacteroides sp. TaxID=162156 RepID=UPI002430B3BC|nr:hypothetical protein [Bacteroides intestinalis]